MNNTEYVHPNVGGVKWMKIGPDMSQRLIELPKAPFYEIRFEMRIRDGSELGSVTRKRLADAPFMRAGSQLAENITRLPSQTSTSFTTSRTKFAVQPFGPPWLTHYLKGAIEIEPFTSSEGPVVRRPSRLLKGCRPPSR